MRGNLETIVGAMFAGKTSELLKRILWAKHQNKKIVVIKPSIDNRYSNNKIITHNDLSHDCYSMDNWEQTLRDFEFERSKVDVVFLDEIQFMTTSDTIENVELFPENQLQIFNRNGQLIYSQRNYGQDESKRFYGKSNTGTSLGTNSYLPSGSYIYIFTYLNEFTNQTKTRKGFVTIHNIIGQ